MHEQALETEGVGGEAQPQQVRMHTGQLVQNHAQVLRTPGNFHAHERFDGLGITERVAEAANAANTFCNIDELVNVARLDEFLQSAMHEADLRNSLNNVLVFNHEVQMQRLGQHRVLRAERNHGRLAHATHRLSQTRRLERRAPSLQMLPSLSQLCLRADSRTWPRPSRARLPNQ